MLIIIFIFNTIFFLFCFSIIKKNLKSFFLYYFIIEKLNKKINYYKQIFNKFLFNFFINKIIQNKKI